MTGHPQPVVTWSKSFGQLPHGRVQYNNSVIKLIDVRKTDSDNYICTARNILGSAVKRTVLVVITLPQFTIKPPVKIVVIPGDILTLNCGATGDPQPVISWKRQGGKLPAGRTQQINGALVIRDITTNDTGNYICVAASAGVFDVDAVTYVHVVQGMLVEGLKTARRLFSYLLTITYSSSIPLTIAIITLLPLDL